MRNLPDGSILRIACFPSSTRHRPVIATVAAKSDTYSTASLGGPSYRALSPPKGSASLWYIMTTISEGVFHDFSTTAAFTCSFYSRRRTELAAPWTLSAGEVPGAVLRERCGVTSRSQALVPSQPPGKGFNHITERQ